MSHVVRNPLARSIEPDPSWRPSPDALEFHRRLPGYRPTPLVNAPGLASRLGVARVLVKDESDRLGLPSFKMLGASWATYCALMRRLGQLGPQRHEPRWSTLQELAASLAPLLPLDLITATDGNHGRAVARTARLLGLGARVFVAEGTAAVRIAAIESEGATVEVVPGDYDAAVRRSAAAANGAEPALLISDTSWDGYEKVPRRVIEGYATIFAEVDAQMSQGEHGARRPDLVVLPVGVGALAAAAVVHYRLTHAGPPPVLAGIEPFGADCVMQSLLAGRRMTVPGPHPSMMVGLNCGTPSLVAWPLISTGIHWCVTVDDEAAGLAMCWLAEEGIVSGETGAAAAAGLGALASTREVGLGPSTTVLVLSTEGATDPLHYQAIVGRSPESVARTWSG